MDVNKNQFMISLLAGLVCVSAAAKAQQRESVLDRIERSIPDGEAGWRLIKDDAYLRTEVDDFPQAALFWTNGVEEVSAYVVVYRGSETARGIFERDYKEEEVGRRTKLEGIGGCGLFVGAGGRGRQICHQVQSSECRRHDEF